MNGAEYRVLEEKLNTIDSKIDHVESMVKDQKDKVCQAIGRITELEKGFAGRYSTCPNVRMVTKHEAELNRMSGIKTFLMWAIPVSITVTSAVVGIIVMLITTGS